MSLFFGKLLIGFLTELLLPRDSSSGDKFYKLVSFSFEELWKNREKLNAGFFRYLANISSPGDLLLCGDLALWGFLNLLTMPLISLYCKFLGYEIALS